MIKTLTLEISNLELSDERLEKKSSDLTDGQARHSLENFRIGVELSDARLGVHLLRWFEEEVEPLREKGCRGSWALVFRV